MAKKKNELNKCIQPADGLTKIAVNLGHVKPLADFDDKVQWRKSQQ